MSSLLECMRSEPIHPSSNGNLFCDSPIIRAYRAKYNVHDIIIMKKVIYFKEIQSIILRVSKFELIRLISIHNRKVLIWKNQLPVI